ncbi:MAG: DNA alkylation repair protein [Bacteroides sp.]|nr:DNA alkylation repair protein [Bacteroides sp.]
MDEILNIWQDMLADEVIEGKREVLQRFFKTAPGEYGEGDVFIGVPVPGVRKVSRLMVDVPLGAVEAMLASEIHEHRLSALLVLVERYKHACKERKRKARSGADVSPYSDEIKDIVDFYLANARRCNNWDLVDLSAPKLLGDYVGESGRTDILFDLSRSANLWEQRIAIVATYSLLGRGIAGPTIEIATSYLTHPHDLIQKATGWMLREMGKKVGVEVLTDFLDRHAARMPRTMLRYSIEKLPADVRRHYMSIPREK